jgi:hypothetical protein
MSLNRDLPSGVAEILDDPIEDQDLFVTKVDCLTIQKTLEHRLTKLESMNAISILCTLGTLAGILAALWKLFGG